MALPETRLRLTVPLDRPLDDRAIRTLLITWLFARARGGEVLLRLDGDDGASPTRFEKIFRDLRWLGLDWDEYGRQSSRIDRHRRALDRLRRAGKLYSCFASDADLAALGDAPYDRRALNETPEEQAAMLAMGRMPVLRFKLPDRIIGWMDMIAGPVSFASRDLGDPIVADRNGAPSPLLCAAIDDGEMLTSHILATEADFGENAAKRAIMESLGYRLPELGHLRHQSVPNFASLSHARTFSGNPCQYLKSLLGATPAERRGNSVGDWLLHFELPRRE